MDTTRIPAQMYRSLRASLSASGTMEAAKRAEGPILVQDTSVSQLQMIADAVSQSQRIIAITGAGISTSAGVPDFCISDRQSRTADTSVITPTNTRSLYHSSALREATQASFQTYHTQQRQLLTRLEVTPTHRFIRDLEKDGRLIRNYSQNIDGFEKKAGLTTDSQGAPKCVQLHGSLDMLRCLYCERQIEWNNEREGAMLAGDSPLCPICSTACEERQKQGKRASHIGILRPDIVLYGERHPRAEEITRIKTFDLTKKPDLLLVLGTRLRVKGAKDMVKEFAKVVHGRGGLVVSVSLTFPTAKEWYGVIDYWVQWECDLWIMDLKIRSEKKSPAALGFSQGGASISIDAFEHQEESPGSRNCLRRIDVPPSTPAPPLNPLLDTSVMATDATVIGLAKTQEFGLDLGASYCCVALSERGTVRTLQHGYNKRIFPSTITIQDDVWHVGKHEVTDIRDDNCIFIHGTKRVMGRNGADKRLETDIKSSNLPFQLDSRGNPFCQVGERAIFPEEICALFFLKAQAIVKAETGMELHNCVVSIPTWFTGTQREAVLAAAQIAGVHVTRLINETTAIATAYLNSGNLGVDGLYGIFNLGGGTFDCSMVSMVSSQEGESLVVEATRGDNMLGGYDFTQVMTEAFRRTIGKEVQVEDDELWSACEDAKTRLSPSKKSINICVAGRLYSIDTKAYIRACEPLRTRIRFILRELSKARSDFPTLKHFILSGGSTFLPWMEDDIGGVFGEADLHRRLPAAEVVAQGSAMAADEFVFITEVLSRSIGVKKEKRVETREDVMSCLLDTDTRLPASHTITMKARHGETTEIKLYEGQHDNMSSYVELGHFLIEAQYGDEIEVHIEVQSDLTITVSATSCNRKRALKVERKRLITDEVIVSMRQRAWERFNSKSSEVNQMGQERKRLPAGGHDRQKKRNRLYTHPDESLAR